ncbi:MAG: glutamine-hydrolyzing carbamoyl-phosphate synthase small subunit [Thermoplasmata archaeon]|nr:glutamine-hydrolyzing carbamoyl-phosphate synthase small subunit [Thermoplasmata archaeon]
MVGLWVTTRARSASKSPRRRGTLFLEDGTRFEGVGFGASTSVVGEVVFTTGMVGYPESLTDPSFRGQILTFTYPLIGNYGVPSTSARDEWGLPRFLESTELQIRGLVVRGLTAPSHWQSHRRIEEWLEESNVPGIAGIDTRRLTEHLRAGGVVRGALHVGESAPSDEELTRRIRRAPAYADEDYMAEVSVDRAAVFGNPSAPLVAVLDCGVKASIVRALLDRGLSVLRLPHDSSVPERWDGHRVEGLAIGNGPGDPERLTGTIAEIARASRSELPILGICLGNQLLALARGGQTFKLKYGHRGQNKTVCFPDGRAMIVSENHGYAVAPDSLRGTGLLPWATNPDDGTLEGLRDRSGRILALQGHPEGHPGPQEAGFVFDRFADRIRRKKR